MKEMIRLMGITKEFEDELIIPTLNLTIYDGEFVTLLGPSGCGKTTMLRMIAGLETPTQGHIFLDNEDVTHLAPYKRNVNMVFQHYALFPHMTVEENIRFGLLMKKVPRKEKQKRIADVLQLTQLEELRYRKPQQMSGGQQQRVSIARALAGNPSVILADEPTGALDSRTGREVLGFLQKLNAEGDTVVLITHDNSIAVKAKRIVRLQDGRIIYDGDAHDPKAVVQPELDEEVGAL